MPWCAPGPIDRILVTHTHHDHSPSAALLKERTGATLHGRVAAHSEWQDTGFVPEVVLGDGEFDGTALQATLHEAGWAYACRTAMSTTATSRG